MQKENKVLINNTIMMYLMCIAKIVIPLVSLPYLTRVLTVDCYGSVSFVKSIINYFQILIEFGFLLSATKDIVDILKNKENPNKVIGDTLYAQIMLCVISVIGMAILCLCMDILKGYELFAFLSLVVVFLSIFLFEYVFKAYEQMGKIAIRYVLMKVVALILTLIFVKNDSQILLIPIFDIIASIVAIVMVIFQMKKLGVSVNFSIKRIKDGFVSLKNSFIYFMSNFATTAFGALNTVIIGICLSTSDVAFWSITMQMVAVVQTLYNPIISSVFPTMLKQKNLKIIHKVMLIYMPLILVGCGLIILLGDWVVTLVFTENYLMSSTLLKYLIPLLIVSFPAMLYGWPCLGPINKQKATTISTIISAVVQVLGLILLAIIGKFTLLGICIVRNATELVLCVIRMTLVYINKNKFVKDCEKCEECN